MKDEKKKLNESMGRKNIPDRVMITDPDVNDDENKEFIDKTGKFIVRESSNLVGVKFEIRNCNECQLYVHDFLKRCTAYLCFNCSIVIGPVKGECSLNIVNDSKVVVFCNQLKVSDCSNL